MGRLLEDMTRLASEVQALHRRRQVFRKELATGNRDRQMDVFEMCADFAGTQAQIAQGAKEERLAFLKNLRRTVGGLQQDMRTDLAAARRVWAGRGA
jgi:hypothetical protein